ncbi:MAG: hypothetical protein ABSF77_19740 [Spirochaetia bacterium]|jgi:hypothetical protein
MVFFIASSCTRDGSGYAIFLGMGSIPANLWNTLVDIVCRWKPLNTWCLAMVMQN